MTIGEKLFPDDNEWLHSTYESIDEVFSSFEFLVDYIKRRFPKISDSKIENYRNSFLIERVAVQFCDKDECPELTLHIGFVENKVLVMVPDNENLSEQERMEIRKEYTLYYGKLIKESNVRVLTLLWSLVPKEAREQIQKELAEKRKKS